MPVRTLCYLFKDANCHKRPHGPNCDPQTQSQVFYVVDDNQSDDIAHLDRMDYGLLISNFSDPVHSAISFASLISLLAQWSKTLSISAVLKAACPTGCKE